LTVCIPNLLIVSALYDTCDELHSSVFDRHHYSTIVRTNSFDRFFACNCNHLHYSVNRLWLIDRLQSVFRSELCSL